MLLPGMNKRRRRYVWVPMPEGRYLARITWYPNEFNRVSFDFEMVDPIPNRSRNDECYSYYFSMPSRSTLVAATEHVVQSLCRDRDKYGMGELSRPKIFHRAKRLRRLREVIANTDARSL